MAPTADAGVAFGEGVADIVEGELRVTVAARGFDPLEDGVAGPPVAAAAVTMVGVVAIP
jgi:hypothetical protein